VNLPEEPIQILAVAGSLRRRSHNRSLLRAAAQLAPASVRLTVYGQLDTIPVFNEDLERAPHDPPGVVRLRRHLARADGLMVATPEYNQSVPGAVKNMIDWLSRSRTGEGLTGRPVAVTGASTGPWGTRIAQTVLRQMLLSTQALVLPHPTLFIPHVESLFDEQGNLTDPETRTRLHQLVSSFADWIRLVNSPATDC
jgi:chromate reductase